MPAGEPPHKEVESDPGREARFELCRLAVEGDDSIEVSRYEVDSDGPSYTVDTLRALRAQEADRELFLIVGGDQAEAFASWREPEGILRLATLAVAERDEHRRDRITKALAALDGAQHVRFFDMPTIEISSSLVRERVAAGRPFRYLVPAAVAKHIEQAGLYRQGVRA
jgi:nicotinate-nucleotide adenylyltransferase